MIAKSYNAEDIRKLRDTAQVGMQEAKHAFELLHDPERGHLFGGDILHALCTIQANGLAISIKGGPEKREAWNVSHGAIKAAALREHVPAVAAAYPPPKSEAPAVDWAKTFYGWCALLNDHRLSVRSYRSGDGNGFVYVARVNESASTSPARPHPSAEEAKAEAIRMALAIPEAHRGPGR